MSSGQENPEVGIAVIQMAVPPDRGAARARIFDVVREAVAGGPKIVCLEELCELPYFCQIQEIENFGLAERVEESPLLVGLSEIAAESGSVIVAPFFEERAAGVFHNSAAVIDADGSLAGLYRKMHVPDDPGFNEKFYFTPGDRGFPVFETRLGRVGVLICWDQWFPEAARLTALAGAEVIFYPTAIGWLHDEEAGKRAVQCEAWEVMLRSHAIANGCYVAAPNRAGFEAGAQGAGEGTLFWGQSVIVAPDGRVLARAGEDDEVVLEAGLDRGALELQRKEWPFFRDRRIDAFAPLAQRWIDGEGTGESGQPKPTG